MKSEKSRRLFIKSSLKAGLTLPFLASGLYSCNSKPEEKENKSTAKDKKLNILILGGTSFLGPHQVAYALSRGHSVSTFTRGKTKPSVHQELFSQVEQLVGDRNNDLTALENRNWDAVIDNSGRNTEWTKNSAELLKDNCGLYLYTSSTGVYYPYISNNYNEDKEVLLSMPEGAGEEEKMEYEYGIMKATSEAEAMKRFGKDRTIIVRPTYMIGPADKTNRFIHWPIRLSQGGEILVPGKASDSVQYVDVRDVAEWMIRLIEQKKGGTYNAVGPKEDQTIHQFIDEAKNTFEVDASFVKIDDYDFLIENKVYYIVPWVIPTGNNRDSSRIDNNKAINNGLSFRPLTESIKDTYDWWQSDAVSQELRVKATSDPKSVLAREKEIIKKWKAR